MSTPKSLKAYGTVACTGDCSWSQKEDGITNTGHDSRRLSYRPRGVSVPVPRLPLSYALLYCAGTVRQYCLERPTLINEAVQ